MSHVFPTWNILSESIKVGLKFIHAFFSPAPAAVTTQFPHKLPSGVFLLCPPPPPPQHWAFGSAFALQFHGEPQLLSPHSNHKLPKGRLAASYPFLNSWPVQALHSGSIHHQQEGRPRFVERGQLPPFRICFNKRLLKAHTRPGTVLVLLLTSYLISKKHRRIAGRA